MRVNPAPRQFRIRVGFLPTFPQDLYHPTPSPVESGGIAVLSHGGLPLMPSPRGDSRGNAENYSPYPSTFIRSHKISLGIL